MNGIFDLKIGFRCNNNCAHCVVADKRFAKDIPLEQIFTEIEKVPESLEIQITGGEPTIYPYLPEILAKCRETNHCTIIQTNGTGFSDTEFFKKCLPYLDHVHIAIHSCYPEIHDKIVSSDGMWKRTIEGFDNLIKEGVSITTQTVLSKYNISSLYDTYCFIQEKAPGVGMSMTYPHLMGNAWKNRENVAFRYSDYKDTFQKVLKDFHELLFVEAIPYCYLHPYAYDVATQARDLIGMIDRVGIDVSSDDPYKDYNYLNVQDHRKAPRCRQCIYNSECLGVWKEYIELYRHNLDLYPILGDENICRQ